jgi:hypothetical protein
MKISQMKLFNDVSWDFMGFHGKKGFIQSIDLKKKENKKARRTKKKEEMAKKRRREREKSGAGREWRAPAPLFSFFSA